MTSVQEREHAVESRYNWCDSVVRDAKVADAAVTRSAKRMDAKLNLAKVNMMEYEKNSQQNVAHSTEIEALAKTAKALSETEDGRSVALYDALGGFTKQLITLKRELGQELAADHRHGGELATRILHQVESHQNFIQTRRQRWARRARDMERSDAALEAALGHDVRHNTRRLVRIKAELSFLTLLSHSKDTDRKLSDRYRSISGRVCSADRLDRLKDRDVVLRQQAAALQKSYAANVAPFT